MTSFNVVSTSFKVSTNFDKSEKFRKFKKITIKKKKANQLGRQLVLLLFRQPIQSKNNSLILTKELTTKIVCWLRRRNKGDEEINNDQINNFKNKTNF